MCGIAGWAGDVGGDAETLTRMRRALVHRGPDAEGEAISKGAALGFRRLAIIDLETGDQPIASEDGGVLVTCNGEIYNFRELRRDLRARGHRFSTASDTEVAVHLYEELGEGFVERLNGMFAIALWDAGAERLVLARDRLGVKPLYWAAAGGGILYASEPGAILASGLVEARPDPRALVEYLALQYVPPPLTGFEGISKLAPGELLIHERGKTRIESYWSLDFEDKRADISESEAVDQLDDVLRVATLDRLVSDVPLGAFLSGGIDSSLVVGYMAEAGATKTFSIDFPEAGFSEGAHARRVAEIYGTEHESRVLEPDIAELVEDVVRHAGEPFADSSAIPTLMLSRMARERVTVALSGDGGDEAFAGYGRYLEVTRPRRLARVAALGLRASGAAGLLSADRRRGVDALAAPPSEHYAALISHFAPDDLRGLCEEGFLQAAGGADRAWRDTVRSADLPGVDRYLALDIATYLPGDLLLKVDRMSMATALEVRSPLLDYRVQEFAASLPPEMKLRGGTLKWALKELARRRGLPDDLVDRPKQGFGVPIGAWLRRELRPWVQGLLLDERSLGRGYFRPAGVRRLLDEHLGGRADHAHRIWSLVALELWHRVWIDAA